jgi:hypothetical protein
MMLHDHLQPHDLTPDLLTPAQYYPDSGRRQVSGVRRLMAALLEDAANIYSRNAGGGETSRLFQEARAWVDSDDRVWPFSFERVCEALQLDAEWVRGRLRAVHTGSRVGAVDARPGGRRRARASRRSRAVRAPRRGRTIAIAVLSRAIGGPGERADDGAGIAD